MRNNPIAYIVEGFLIVFIILALLPAWHEMVQDTTAALNPAFSIIVRFLFDPLDYVWKWIVGLIALIAYFINKK